MISNRLDVTIPTLIVTTGFIILFLFYFTMYVLPVPYRNYIYRSQAEIRSRDLVHDIEKDSQLFQIRGFQYYDRTPLPRRPQLRSEGVWILTSHMEKGTISFTEQEVTAAGVKRDATVMIRYHLDMITRARLVVTGVSDDTLEIVSTELTQTGDGFCTRVVYLGCVHQILIEGEVDSNHAFILIDELKIGVNTNHFDGINEETCD